MSSKYVKIYYGPCESFHTLIHRPQKLYKFRDVLRKRGYRVDIVPVEWINYCMIEMCKHEVFRCNIKNMIMNNSPHTEKLPPCQVALRAVLEATEKIERARTYLWVWNLLSAEIFNQHLPKSYFASNFQIDPLIGVECFKCCDIRVPTDPNDVSNVASNKDDFYFI